MAENNQLGLPVAAEGAGDGGGLVQILCARGANHYVVASSAAAAGFGVEYLSWLALHGA